MYENFEKTLHTATRVTTCVRASVLAYFLNRGGVPLESANGFIGLKFWFSSLGPASSV